MLSNFNVSPMTVVNYEPGFNYKPIKPSTKNNAWKRFKAHTSPQYRTLSLQALLLKLGCLHFVTRLKKRFSSPSIPKLIRYWVIIPGVAIYRLSKCWGDLYVAIHPMVLFLTHPSFFRLVAFQKWQYQTHWEIWRGRSQGGPSFILFSMDWLGRFN